MLPNFVWQARSVIANGNKQRSFAMPRDRVAVQMDFDGTGTRGNRGVRDAFAERRGARGEVDFPASHA